MIVKIIETASYPASSDNAYEANLQTLVKQALSYPNVIQLRNEQHILTRF